MLPSQANQSAAHRETVGVHLFAPLRDGELHSLLREAQLGYISFVIPLAPARGNNSFYETVYAGDREGFFDRGLCSTGFSGCPLVSSVVPSRYALGAYRRAIRPDGSA